MNRRELASDVLSMIDSGPSKIRWSKVVPVLLKADRSNPRILFYLGVCFDNGKVVQRDPRKAAQFYRRAGKLGHAAGAYNIALCYRDGFGVTQNLKSAVNWLRVASRLGDVDAQRDLGYNYFYGLGTRRNRPAAVRLYRQSAQAGDVKAQYNLALCYLYGDGVKRNIRWARHWLDKACTCGHRRACKLLSEV